MDELLAKPDKSLFEHLLETYEIGKILVKQLNIEGDTAKRALLACLMHDVGKATESFQGYIRKKTGRAYPHALASVPFVLVAEGKLLGKPYAAVASVLSHHSPLSGMMYKGWNSPGYHLRLPELLKQIFEVLDLDDLQINWEEIYSDGLKLRDVSNLLHGSGEIFLEEMKNIPSDIYSSVKAVLHLSDWMASANIKDPSLIFLNDGEKRVHDFVEGRFKLWNFQKEVLKVRGTHLRLRAPTGSGKTEALLLWASDMKRIIYLLPTQATVNAMWMRLSEIYGEENVGISHGRAGYVIRKELEYSQEEDAFLDYKLFASVFAKPVVVATLDQFLIAFMKGRHWEERQVLSKDAAIIIDEVHSYELFTLGILKYVLHKGKFGKVAIASATLPSVLLDLFGGEKLVVADESFWMKKRYRINLVYSSVEEYIDEMVKLAKEGKNVLVIVNTVGKSQEVFRQLKERWGNVFLLHSRFIYRDRLEKEKLVMKTGESVILVATQVVEVSLDISYDVLFTELAPVDALIQRMGRVNRKGEKDISDVFVFTELDAGALIIYGSDILEVSKDIIGGLDSIPSEQELALATERLYSYMASMHEFHRQIDDGERNIEEINNVLGNFTIDLSDEEFRSRFITRRGIFSVDVIPDSLVDEAYTFVNRGERWKLVELTVPVHGYWWRLWPSSFVISKDLGYPIVSFEYSSEMGLIRPQEIDKSGFEVW